MKFDHRPYFATWGDSEEPDVSEQIGEVECLVSALRKRVVSAEQMLGKDDERIAALEATATELAALLRATIVRAKERDREQAARIDELEREVAAMRAPLARLIA